MKNILSLILAVLMLAGALALTSCADAGGDQTAAVTTAAEGPGNNTEPGETEPQFSTNKYDGDTFTVYARTKQSSYSAVYIVVDEQDGDLVNDAAYKVCCNVADRFGVTLQLKEASDPSSSIKADCAGGDLDYDIVLDRRSGLANRAIEGSLQDFNALGIDLSAPWWDANCVRDLTIKGKNFIMANSVSIAKVQGIRFFYFNKQMIQDYNLQDPYELYDKDEWILDTFLELVKGVSAPTSDGSLGTYGLVLETGDSNGIYMHMLTGSGITYGKTDEDGAIVCTVGDQLDKIDQFFEKVNTVFKDSSCVLTMDEAVKADTLGEASGITTNKYDKSRGLWSYGHFLFTHTSIAPSSQFTEMVDDYGVMPNPKYDKNQENYAHKCDRHTLIWAIPNSKEVNMQKVSDVMDFWAYQAEKEVIPAYYDMTIKTKRVKEVKASEIIDVVRGSVRYELIDIFDVSNLRTALNNGWNSGSVSGKWKSYNTGINSQIKKINESMEIN